MCKLIILIAFLVGFDSNGQNILKGQILSVTDSTPVIQDIIRIDRKEFVRTDSAGFFTISTGKKKVQLSSLRRLYSFDTTVYLSPENDILKLYTSKLCDSSLAKYDIRRGMIRLFCGVGIVPRALMEWDRRFEKKYQITYFLLGCVLPSSRQQLISYNIVVAEHLDKTFGKFWRLEARNDIPGITEKVSTERRSRPRQ